MLRGLPTLPPNTANIPKGKITTKKLCCLAAVTLGHDTTLPNITLVPWAFGNISIQRPALLLPLRNHQISQEPTVKQLSLSGKESKRLTQRLAMHPRKLEDRITETLGSKLLRTIRNIDTVPAQLKVFYNPSIGPVETM